MTRSRLGSSRPERDAGEIRKKRQMPYKTETRTEMVKKKKLKLQTSYNKVLPGYTFLPVGTPDLAERCKELSRQRGFRVDVVNATPRNTFAKDPKKVSHHVHRIGYHFKAEVVDQAREELGYIIHGTRFIKEADLRAENQQSYIASVMKRNGLYMDDSRQETPKQVRDIIKELFPRIPKDDLEQIVARAWEEGMDRVGTDATLELPRRVQLATIARIRHTHTDYDRLLRAFAWRDARRLVEPQTLVKLIDWRGEHDTADDNELEEIVREIIVIPDDDDEEEEEGEGNVIYLTSDGEADNEDSDAALGNISDASVEFTHRLAGDEDLRPESANGIFKRSQRLAPLSKIQQQKSAAKQKIGEVRRSMRHPLAMESASNFDPLYVPVNLSNAGSDGVVHDGHLYLRETIPQFRAAPPQTQFSHQQTGAYEFHNATSSYVERVPAPVFTPGQGNGSDSSIHAVPSIEPHIPVLDHAMRSIPTMQSAALPTFHNYQPEERPRVVYSPDHFKPMPPTNPYQPTVHFQSHGAAPRMPHQGNEVVDLTTPERHSRSGNPSPMRDVNFAFVRSNCHGREQHAYSLQAADDRRWNDRPTGTNHLYQMPAAPVPYDPTRPTLDLVPRENPYDLPMVKREPDEAQPAPAFEASRLDLNPRENPYDLRMVKREPAEDQPAPLEGMPPYKSAFSRQGGTQLFPRAAYPSSTHQAPPSGLIPASSWTPHPVHGAPAPVQQVPLGTGNPRGSAFLPNPQPFPTTTNILQSSPPRPIFPPPLPWLQQQQPQPHLQPGYGAPRPGQYYTPR